MMEVSVSDPGASAERLATPVDLRIVDVRARTISHRLDGQGVRFGIGRAIKRDAVIVRVEADNGLVGFGEAHHALSPTTVAELVNTSLREIALGSDPTLIEDLWHRVYRYQIRSHGMGEGVYIALSGLDMALWDLTGKALGLPVCRLLGAAPKRFPAYAGGITLGYQEPSALSDELAGYVERFGFGAAKLRLGDTVERDVARVRRIRNDFGPDFAIMVDVNTAYDWVDLLRLLPALEDLDVAWLEEPFPRRELDALAELRRRSKVPIAAGENHYGRDDMRELLGRRCIDVVQGDASKTGGISELKKISDLATLHRLRFAPHTSHTNLNYAATLHVMSASPVAYFFEAAGIRDNGFSEAAITAPIDIRDGYVETPDLPGLGVTVDEAALDDFAALPGAQNAG